VIRRVIVSTAAVLVGVLAVLAGTPIGHSDPFTPSEQQFLNDVKPNLQGYGDARASAMNDGQLVGTGWQACHYRAIGQSPQRYGINPVIGNYAYKDLCPNG
jgi:hypothetical protein